MGELVPAYAKVSTVGVAGSVVADKVDLAMPVMPPNVEGITVEQLQNLSDIGSYAEVATSWSHTKTDWATIGLGISGGGGGSMYTDQVESAKWTGTPGDPYAVPATIPESMCGNCRRDWHEAPLTERVARMYDQLAFDEDYDPAADTSPIVCPGSEYCGPIAPPASYYRGSGFGWSSLPAVSMDEAYPPSWITQMYDSVAKSIDQETLKVLLGPHWKSANPSFGFGAYSQYVEHFGPKPWTFEPEPPPSEKLLKKMQNMQDVIQILMGDEPPLEVKTSFPDIKYAKEWPFIDDGVPQAAIEAAPKAVEMDHKPPVSAGFDFSHVKDVPGYYQPPKRKKKKK